MVSTTLITRVQAYHLGAIFVEAQMDDGHRQWFNMEYHHGYCKGISPELDQGISSKTIKLVRNAMFAIGQELHGVKVRDSHA